ncbi:MAG TPA: cytochrome P450, partial [Labilithrix sp.]|nr:cytochrome P450 [Labilithrix sp.]
MTAASLHAPPPAPPTPIPYVPGYPLLGHLPSWQSDRIGLLLRLTGSHADIVEVPMGIALRLVMIGSPALANEVFVTKQSSFEKARSFKTFLRPVLGEGLLTSERDFHARQRRLLAPAFVHKRIASMATMMAEHAQRFVSRVHDGESLDLADAMTHLAFEIVGKALFAAEMGGDAEAVGVALTT